MARRGAELLDSKRRALLEHEQRLREDSAGAARDWDERYRTADRALVLAALLSGERHLELSQGRRPGWEVELRWQSEMGVAFPTVGRITSGAPEGLVAAGGSSALEVAADTFAGAVAAAIKCAVARRALETVRAELALTSRRQRVIERRWQPALRAAIHDLEVQLDELEREDGTRSRWVKIRRLAAQPLASWD